MHKQNKIKEKHTIYSLKTIKKAKVKCEAWREAFRVRLSRMEFTRM